MIKYTIIDKYMNLYYIKWVRGLDMYLEERTTFSPPGAQYNILYKILYFEYLILCIYMYLQYINRRV